MMAMRLGIGCSGFRVLRCLLKGDTCSAAAAGPHECPCCTQPSFVTLNVQLVAQSACMIRRQVRCRSSSVLLYKAQDRKIPQKQTLHQLFSSKQQCVHVPLRTPAVPRPVARPWMFVMQLLLYRQQAGWPASWCCTAPRGSSSRFWPCRSLKSQSSGAVHH